MADSLPPHASVKLGSGSANRPSVARPPPGPISFPPPLSPQPMSPGGNANAVSSPLQSPGNAPVTQFTFRKGVHLPAIKSPPKMPLLDSAGAGAGAGGSGSAAASVASPSAAGSPAAIEFAKLGDDTPPASRPVTAAASASAAASPAGAAANDDEDAQHYKLSKPYTAKPFVEAKTAQGPNAQGAEFVSPAVASNEWADWHLKLTGGKKAEPKDDGKDAKGTKVLVAASPLSAHHGRGAGASAAPGVEPSVSAGDAILDVGGLESERNQATAGGGGGGDGLNGMTVSQKARSKRNAIPEHYTDREAAELVHEKERRNRLIIIVLAAAIIAAIIAFAYNWGANPENYATQDDVSIVAANSANGRLEIDNSTLTRGSVLGDHVAYHTLTEYNFADGSVDERTLADGSVTADKLTPGLINTALAAVTNFAGLVFGGAGNTVLKSDAIGSVTVLTGQGGLSIDTIHSGGLASASNPGPTTLLTDALTATVTQGAAITAKNVALDGAQGVSLTSSAAGVSVTSPAGAFAVASNSVDVHSGSVTANPAYSGAGWTQVAGANGAVLRSTLGETLVSAGTNVRISAPAGVANVTAATVSVKATSSLSLQSNDLLNLAASRVVVKAPVQNSVSAVSMSSTIAVNGTISYVIDFANLPSSLLQFSGVVTGPVTITVQNCDATTAGIDVKLLNALTSSVAQSAPLLQLSQATCSGGFAASIASGASSSISCVGPLPNAPANDTSRVLCARQVGAASSLSAVSANGTLGLSDGVAEPGSVNITATAGVINLRLMTGNDAGYNWGLNTGSNGYLRASFWLYSPEFSSAHSGVQFTLISSGSLPTQSCGAFPCSGKNKPGSEGVFLITNQQAVPGMGVLVTLTIAYGQVFPGEIISYIFTLI